MLMTLSIVKTKLYFLKLLVTCKSPIVIPVIPVNNIFPITNKKTVCFISLDSKDIIINNKIIKKIQ